MHRGALDGGFQQQGIRFRRSCRVDTAEGAYGIEKFKVGFQCGADVIAVGIDQTALTGTDEDMILKSIDHRQIAAGFNDPSDRLHRGRG